LFTKAAHCLLRIVDWQQASHQVESVHLASAQVDQTLSELLGQLPSFRTWNADGGGEIGGNLVDGIVQTQM
jgi:hypothetical protein